MKDQGASQTLSGGVCNKIEDIKREISVDEGDLKESFSTVMERFDKI
jgi:hypothetical protein